MTPAEKAPMRKYFMAASPARRSVLRKPVRMKEVTLINSRAMISMRKSVAETRSMSPRLEKRSRET